MLHGWLVSRLLGVFSIFRLRSRVGAMLFLYTMPAEPHIISDIACREHAQCHEVRCERHAASQELRLRYAMR